MTQVHINDNILVLGKAVNEDSSTSGWQYWSHPVKEDVASLLNRMLTEKLEPQVLQGDAEELIRMIESIFTPIEAAGGLVTARGERLLLIFRRGKWDLPKGKRDEGEDLETCALREVKEETGLGKLKIGAKIMVTYHAYQQWGQKWIKASHWYKMHSEGDEPLVPQTDEDIERCEWVVASDLGNYIQNMHGSIQEVLKKGAAVGL